MTDTRDYVYLTPEGHQKLLADLKKLKTVDRPQIIAEISRARDLGDLSENAEYHAAKERQVIIERKIGELESSLSRAKTIEAGEIDSDRAFLLSYVRVRDAKTGEEIRYRLVSPEESDFDLDLLSIHSPVGEALLGVGVGDKVSIQVPAGKLVYEILDVSRTE